MHPVVLGITLLAVIVILFLRRSYAPAAILVPLFLTPFGEQLLVGGFHLFVFRCIVFAGLTRMIVSRRRVPFTAFEKTFFLWAFFRGITFILLFRATGAAIAQVAFWLDAYGGYLLFRYAIEDREDLLRTLKVLSIVAAVLAVCMSFESLTRVDVFSYINGRAIIPWIRDGRVRAQSVFSNSITAGTFGATLLPLFFWMWKSYVPRVWGAVGLVAATGIVITSVASTAVSAFLGGILALCCWPLRKQMRRVRWGIVIVVVALALAMKAPIWYLVAKVDFVGGHGWDRGYLIDQFAQHWSSWWLLGTADNASWGNDTWDACNQFVAEGLGGGLVSLILFITLLKRGFGIIGKARASSQGNREQEWFFWCLGAALFAHLIAFFGIDYFDNLRIWWFAFLAMISAAVARAGVATEPSPDTAVPVEDVWLLNADSRDAANVEVPAFS